MQIGKHKHLAGTLLAAAPIIAVAAAFAALFFSRGLSSTTAGEPSCRRIVSLSPAVSRQIRDLGEEDRIVGVTSWDDLAKKQGVTIIGNLIQINMETLVTLRPDMIFSSMEDAVVQRVEKIRNLGLPYHSFARNSTYEDIERNYLSLARMLGREADARRKLAAYRRELNAMGRPATPPVIAFFVSHDPLIPVTGASHMHSIIIDAGGRDAFGCLNLPYPTVSAEALMRADPDIIVSMAHGGGDRLSRLAKTTTSLRAIREGRIFYVPYDSFCSFTPADYIASVKILSGIIEKAAVHAR